MKSIFTFINNETVKSVVTGLEGSHKQQAKSYRTVLAALARKKGATSKTPSAVIKNIDSQVPIRTTRGPLAFGLPASKLSKAEASWYSGKDFTLTGAERFELVNFVDGKMTVTEIRNALSAEFRPIRQREVKRYLEDLIKVGVMKWK